MNARRATLLYAALTLAFTWPLVRGLARDVPGDFGDPLLNAWILAWDATHIGRGWWSANIFHPHPLALGYSEHLLAQALQVLPIYAVTRNPILAYNLLFLSTFVLSGLGMFLLIRELTGDRGAAFVAGAAYAFAPYRVPSMPHVQVLSSAWMPFVLFAFRRFFHVRERDGFRRASLPLAGAAVAWLAQNLSSGYYLLFFSPIVVLYLAWEITTRSLWRDRRVLGALAAACAAVGAATVPFLLPYLELRHLGFSPRSLSETIRFSADTHAYLTADPNLKIWGPILQGWPKAEGSLFPGLTIVALGAIGVGRLLWDSPIPGSATQLAGAGRTRPLWLVPVAAAVVILVTLLLGWSIRLPGLRIASFPRALTLAVLLLIVGFGVSRDLRRRAARWLASPSGLFAAIALFAIAMSWGPTIVARGRPVADTNLYAAFYAFVPGFDGVRVPARFAMIAAFALAALAGLGVAALRGASRKAWLAPAAAAAIFVESFAAPIPINENAIDYVRQGLAPLPGTVTIAGAPKIYGAVAGLPADAALIELPLGEPAFDVRYMFFSTTHWRRLVNGYSGGAPADYERLDQSLQDVLTRPDRAWAALAASRATYAIVHEAFYAGDRGVRVSEWLRAHGARETAAVNGDRLFQLP